jgi:glycosyltransferase involved in cell wall biosynthesis
MNDPRVHIVNTHRMERAFVRNTGVSLSRGRWLYLLDDDDYPLPGAFQALLEVTRKAPDAVHVYGAYDVEFIRDTDSRIETIRPHADGYIFPLLFGGSSIPFQASWLRRDAFVRSGGYSPLRVPADDGDLLPRIVRQGPSRYTEATIAHIRVGHASQTSSTDADAMTRMMRLSFRDLCRDPSSLSALREQTRKAPYYAGMCTHTYLRTMYNRLRERGFCEAGSRCWDALRLAAPHLLSPPFWKGFRRR